MNLITNRARVYVNFGRVIADCPIGCGGAMVLEPGQAQFFCSPPGGCGHIAEVEWPENLQEILDALSERPLPKNRNWFPVGHELGVRAGCPTGQTPEELRAEAEEMTNGG